MIITIFILLGLAVGIRNGLLAMKYGQPIKHHKSLLDYLISNE